LVKAIGFLSLMSPIIALDLGVNLKLWMILGCVFILLNIKNFKIYTSEVTVISILFVASLLSLAPNIADITNNQAIYLLFGPMQMALALWLSRFFDEQLFVKIIWVYLAANVIYGLYGLSIIPDIPINNETYGGIFIQYGLPRLSGLAGDPNMLAFYLCLIIFLVNYFDIRNVFWPLVICVLLTQSRTGFAIILVLGLVLGLIRFKDSIRGFPIILFVLAMFLIFLGDDLAGLYEYYQLKMVTVASIGGRRELWEAALEYIQLHPFQGIGLGGSRAFIEHAFGTYTYIHNTYIELFLELGLVFGFVIVGLIFLPILVATRKWSSIVCYVIIVGGFMATLSLAVNEVLWFTIGILLNSRRTNHDFYRKHDE